MTAATFQALFVALVGVMPGALYVWAFEREIGRWGIGLSDRILRFLGFSAIFHAVFIVPELWVYSNYLHRRTVVNGRIAFTNLVTTGAHACPFRGQGSSCLPIGLWPVVLGYVAVPLAVGLAAASLVRRGSRWGRWIAGRAPAPRAWDFLFASRPSGLVRFRLKDSGAWIGGLFGAHSYAAGYPETPQDLFIERVFRMREDGSFEEDDEGQLVSLGSGILVRWDEVETLEFFLLE
jgi:hypothetical protein